MRALLIRVIAVGSTVVAFAATLAAQALAAQDGFRPFVPGQGAVEQLPATPLVFSAYAFVWVALVAYVFSMWRRVTRLEAELRRLQERTGGARRP